ncbi:protein kinase [Myxococcota bacterium]|nr:protein kinase [Myxococcota bacterium]
MLDPSFHRFGPFIIVRTLGRGGMGEVFIARTPSNVDPVAAVKRLRPDVARVPTFAERFRHESELAVLLDHPNIVRTLDTGSVDGQLYVSSELILGKDTGFIGDKLRERGQGGPAAVAISILSDILRGLEYVHGVQRPDGRALRLVHRDVTPGNVLVGYDGIARLADFGLAKSELTENARLTSHGEILGTPHYLAPEIIKGDPASPASDLYGLGAVMYRFLTGVAPYSGTTAEVLMKVLTLEPRALTELRPDLPPWFVAFVQRMMDRDPARRPNDASVLLKQLTQDARQAGLLVPRPMIGRWLADLFQAERTEQLEEYDRIVALDPRAIPGKTEGTVVLARYRAGSRLEAPGTARPPDDHDDLQGTDLELSRDDVRGAAEQRSDRRPIVPLSDLDLSPPGPSDVTQAAQKIDLPTIADSGFEEESLDGMPTRAVAVLPKTFLSPTAAQVWGADAPKGASPKRGDDETFDPVTTDEGRPRPDPGESETHLPGFLDAGAKRTVERSRVAKAPKVVVPPGPTEPLGPQWPEKTASDDDRGAREPAAPATRDKPRADASIPPVAPKGKGKAAPKESFGRNVAVLIGLLAVAVALGIGIGVVVATLKAPAQKIVHTSPLRERLERAKAELDQRKARGEVILPRAWELLANASLALAAKDEARADADLVELERLLASKP